MLRLFGGMHSAPSSKKILKRMCTLMNCGVCDVWQAMCSDTGLQTKIRCKLFTDLICNWKDHN